MNIKTLALVAVLASFTGQIALQAADAPASTATPQPEGRRGFGGGRGGPGFADLTKEEQDKYRAAAEAAGKDPKVQAAREKMSAAAKELREATDAAMLAADPSLDAIIKKLAEAREKAMANRPARNAN